MRALDIGIVGCGTAGTAAALLLSKAGHRTELIERVHVPAPVGAGIVLQPSGMRVLEGMGLLSPILAAGARLDGLRCDRHKSWALLDLRYARLGRDLFGLGLHRGVLFETLYAALPAAGVSLHLGREAIRLEAFRDRHALRFADGGRSAPYDLVVVADGARSRLRDQHATRATVKRYPYGALWFVGPARSVPRSELLQVVDGTRELIGLLPTGHGPDRARGPLLSLFYSIAEADLAALRAEPLSVLKDRVRDRLPAAAELVEQIEHWDELLFAAYYDVVMPAWHDRGVVYLGDAAHATSPQLGQGCNLALCDAAALAAALAAHEDLGAALAAYTVARRASLGFYQRATRWLTPLFQSDDDELGPLRDLAFPILARLPFFERRMLESMAGLSTGWFSASAPEPAAAPRS